MTGTTNGSSIPRREFLRAGSMAALAGLGMAGCQSTTTAHAELATHRPKKGYLFALGVASGEPTPDSVVLWTRLAPDPLEGGGMPPQDVRVAWEIAEDESMKRVVRRGNALATAAWAHSVHVEVRGLAPGRWYWYRFIFRDEASPVGRTRTMPAAGTMPDTLRFAAVSCQDFQNGYYAAYRHLARESLDLVLHLGDYIYEYPGRDGRTRKHVGDETVTLADYRNRHAQYRTDPDLQAAHAAFPWMVIWDDHEVENDYANAHSEKQTPAAEFLKRRAAAYRAYYEHMPLPPSMAPRGIALPLYRRRAFGGLVDLFLLDGRQYRSDQACPGPRYGGQVIDPTKCAELADPRRTMLGAAQERWLGQGLARSRGRWTVIGQQMLFSSLVQPMRDGTLGVWSEGWDGYPLARKRITDRLAAAKTPNPVILGGDIHSYWVTDVKTDYRDPRAPTVASEFVATSISSSRVPQILIDAGLKLDHVRYADSRFHGYLRFTVTPGLWRTDLQTVDSVASPEAKLATLKSFVVESGRPGPKPA